MMRHLLRLSPLVGGALLAAGCGGGGGPPGDENLSAPSGQAAGDEGAQNTGSGGTLGGVAPGAGGATVPGDGIDTGSGGATNPATGGVTPGAAEVVLEENAVGFCAVEGAVEASHSGFSGAGYANAENVVGGGVEWQVISGAGAPVEMVWRYASVSERAARLLVNDSEVVRLLFPATGAWTTWSNVTTEVTLPPGTSRIRLEATGAEGLPNLDSLTVKAEELAVDSCAAPLGPEVDPNKEVSIYLVGDSTVMDYSVRSDYLTNYFPQAGWGEMLQGLLTPDVMLEIGHVVPAGKARVVNWAMGGRSSRSFWEEGRWQQVYDLLQADDFVFIQFGHNDEASCTDYPERCTPIPQYREFLRKYVDATRSKGATPVLITPLNRGYPWSNGLIANSHGEYPAAMIQVARETQAPVIDGSRRSLELFNARGENATTREYFMVFDAGAYPQFKVTTTYPQGSPSNDRTHLQQAGARAIAGIVVEGLRDLVEIVVTIEPTSCGTVAGAGWWEQKFTSSTNLVAEPAAGCAFRNWSGDALGTNPTVAVAVDGNKSITAHFDAL